MNSLSRLDRPIVGQRQCKARPIVERAELRVVEKPPVVELPDHTRETETKIRPNRRQADPHPNAPQLIRLNRNPFPLHQSAFSRNPIPTLSLVRPERRAVADWVGEARDAYVKMALIRPTEVRERLQPRPRISADRWLDGQGGDHE